MRAGSPALAVAKWAGAALAPVIITAAHLFYGAALLLPALVMFACLLAVLFVALASKTARRDLDRLRPLWPLVGLFAAVLAVALLTLTPWLPGGGHAVWAWSGGAPAATLNRSATKLEILKLAGLAAPFLLGCVFGARIDSARRLYACLLAVGVIYAVASLVLFMGGPAGSTTGLRLAGGFESANIAGTVFGMLMVLAVAWGVRFCGRPNGADQMVTLASTAALVLLFLACLLLTASRGALAATGLALALFGAWAARNNRRWRGPLFLGGALILASAVLFHAQGTTLFLDRLGSAGPSSASRADLLAPHWRAFLEAPLFGWGLGSFPELNSLVMTPDNAEALSATVVLHNVYLQWLVEAGLIGAAPVFVLISVVLGLTAQRGLRGGHDRVLIAGLLGASLIVLLHAASDVSLNTPSVCAFWSLLLGLGFAMSQARADAPRPS